MLRRTVKTLRVIAAISVDRAKWAIEFGQFLLYKFYRDSVTASDSSSIGTGKPQSDSAQLTDSPSLSQGKNLSEALAVFESSRYSAGKAISDGLDLSEQRLHQVSKPLSESPYIADLPSLGFSASRSDNGSASDDSSHLVGKGLDDQAGAVDSSIFGVVKNLSDGVYLGDLIGAFNTSKLISESIAATDDINGAAADDDQNMQFFKVTSDNGAITDNQVKSLQPARSDSGTTTDSGSGRGQDYCDFSYFAEDYVGYSFTF